MTADQVVANDYDLPYAVPEPPYDAGRHAHNLFVKAADRLDRDGEGDDVAPVRVSCTAAQWIESQRLQAIGRSGLRLHHP